jgi:hypothetical protein
VELIFLKEQIMLKTNCDTVLNPSMDNHRRSTLRKSMLFLGLTLSCIMPSLAATYYVKLGSNNGNGTSWSQAFNNLDAALSAASASGGADEIWVAAGTYKPSIIYQGGYSGTEHNLKTFKLPSHVAIYGGFKGNETQLKQRDCHRYQTILSGDLDGNDVNIPSRSLDNKADNAWHVLTAEGVTNVLLDGITVQNGYATGPDAGTLGPKFTLVSLDYTHAAGGGLSARRGSKVTLNNMQFTYNATDSVRATVRGSPMLGGPALASGGGAVASEDEGTLVIIKNTSFDRNTAFNFGSNGGALSARLEGSFEVAKSTFTNNNGNRNGGAIHGKDADHITVTDSLLKNNNSVGQAIGDESGGAIGIINSNLTVSRSRFDNNTTNLNAGGGGGAIIFQTVFDTGEPYVLNVKNSVFKDNSASSLGGGGIIAFGTLPNSKSKATIKGCLFSGNQGGIGGAVYADSLPTVISDSVFYNNKAWVNGGAIFGSNFGDAIFGVTDLAARSTLDIKKSNFVSNTISGAPATAALPTVAVFNLFANFQSSINSLPPAGVTALTPGGGAIAVELGGNVKIRESVFKFNSAPNGYGGALLVGGAQGFSGTDNLGMNQAFTTLKESYCHGNSAALGGNNTFVLDPIGLGSTPNGVTLISDGDGGCH